MIFFDFDPDPLPDKRQIKIRIWIRIQINNRVISWIRIRTQIRSKVIVDSHHCHIQHFQSRSGSTDRPNCSRCFNSLFCYCFWIRDPGKAKIAVFRIHLFFGYPDLLVRGMDPDPSIIIQKYEEKTLIPTILWLFDYLSLKINFNVPAKSNKQKKLCKKIGFLMASWRSISQRHGSADPDPHQNVMDPEHCLIEL